MPPLAAFFLGQMVPIYFFYGLAFFSMGLAVALESRRASGLPIARAMGLLAAFGLLHGAHEWVDMAQLLAGATAPWVVSPAAEAARIALLSLSFLALFLFGARLLMERHWPGGVLRLGAGVFFLWLAAAWVIGDALTASLTERLVLADVLARYLLALPASILTAWGLALQRRVLQEKRMPGFGRDLSFAAAAFLLYGVLGQLFTKPSLIFPSTILNTGTFLMVFGIPVQLFRGATAAVIAMAVISALRAFEQESRQELVAANEARLAAQRDALLEQRKRQEETAQLNQELQVAARELTVLYDLSRLLSSTLELDTLLKEAVQRIVDALGYVSAASIWLGEEGSGELTLMACQGCQETPEGTRTPTETQPFDQARRLVRAAMNTHSAMGSFPSGAIAPIIGAGPKETSPDGRKKEIRPRQVAVPLIWKDQTRGALLLEVGPQEAGFSSADLPLIGALSVPLSMAVENAILYGEARSRDALRGELLGRIVRAQEAERQRIARELHDETGQALTALGLGLKGTAATVKTNPAQAARQLDELRAEVSAALDALRRLVSDLRPAQLDDLGLAAALRWYVDDLAERLALQASVTVRGTPRRLRPEVESVLFRIAQEALTNVAKHAGANRVTVELTFGQAAVEVTVTDDGIGFDPEKILKPQARRKAWGLFGIRERAELVGAECDIDSRPREGTRVRVRVPLGKEPVEEVRDSEEDTPAPGG